MSMDDMTIFDLKTHILKTNLHNFLNSAGQKIFKYSIYIAGDIPAFFCFCSDRINYLIN